MIVSVPAEEVKVEIYLVVRVTEVNSSGGLWLKLPTCLPVYISKNARFPELVPTMISLLSLQNLTQVISSYFFM